MNNDKCFVANKETWDAEVLDIGGYAKDGMWPNSHKTEN